MDRTQLIRALNDRARQGFEQCRVQLSPAVQSHPHLHKILRGVRCYDAFNPNNDPYEEHDFGSFSIDGDVVFWKWDYFDWDLQYHSPDPSDPNITCRVLTIMLADEY